MTPPTAITPRQAANKVPEVTLLFWIIKVAATTLGETAGDAVSMSMHLGYLVVPTVVVTMMVRTTLADFADRSLGIGYAGGTALLAALLLTSLALWYRTLGTVSIATINSPKAEVFYWVTIMFSQTLGTALGDWTADTAGLGYRGGALVFSGLLALLALAYYRTGISRTFLFWAAFVLTRPLGAVVGDLLDKPLASGGLALNRFSASAALIAFIIGCILLFPQRAARTAH
ncbi:MAG: hypothetical protein ABI633_06055 [Burkholderiales bacterium]